MNLRRWAAVIAIAMLPAACYFTINFDQVNFGSFHDDGLYFIAAKSFAQSGALQTESLPSPMAATKYPPLWPWLLSTAWRVSPDFPANLRIAGSLSFVLFPLFLSCCAALLRRLGLSDFDAASVVILTAWSPSVVVLVGSLMSEILFCALLVVTLLQAERAEKPQTALIAGLLAGAAFLARSVGIVLLAGVPLVLLLRKRRVCIAPFVLGMLPSVLGWILWSASHRTYSGGDWNLLTYIDYSALFRSTISSVDPLQLVWMNVGLLISAMGQLLIYNQGATFLTNYASQLLGILAILGTVQWQRRSGISHWSVYGVGLFAMFSVWCYAPIERFLLPVFPLFLAGLLLFGRSAAGTLRKACREKRGAEKAIAYAGILLIAGLAASWAVTTFNGLAQLPNYVRHYRSIDAEKRALYDWIRRETPPSAVIIASNDPAVYLQTGRKSMGLHPPTRIFYQGDRTGAVNWFSSLPWPDGWPRPDYLLWTPDSFEMDLSSAERKEVLERLTKDGRIQTAFQAGESAVYRILK